MSDSKANPSNVNNKNVRRNLPLWMSLRENESKSHGKKLDDADEHEENDGNKTPKQAKDCDKPFSGSTPSKKTETNKKSSPSSFGATNFSKLLEWISECYRQKKLVDIESYLMHAGKPQRRQNVSHESSQDPESSVSRKAPMQIDGGSHAKSASSATKPEASEIKKIAAEGILSCLQDAIDSLKQKQDIQQMIEQWIFIPRVDKELANLEVAANGSVSISKEELCREAMSCKQIYEVELGNFDDDLLVEKKKKRTNASEKDDNDTTKAVTGDAAACDSDETIEMTEEAMDLVYNTIASKLGKP